MMMMMMMMMTVNYLLNLFVIGFILFIPTDTNVSLQLRGE